MSTFGYTCVQENKTIVKYRNADTDPDETDRKKKNNYQIDHNFPWSTHL